MPATRTVASVVEGHGDVKALPVLARRVAEAVGVFDLTIPQPHRCPRNEMIALGPSAGPDLVRVMRFQAARAGRAGVLLVVVDADDDEPAAVASVIVEVAAALPCPTIAVPATREYEAWFLAALESLQSHPLIRDDAEWAGDPRSLETPRVASPSAW